MCLRQEEVCLQVVKELKFATSAAHSKLSGSSNRPHPYHATASTGPLLLSGSLVLEESEGKSYLPTVIRTKPNKPDPASPGET